MSEFKLEIVDDRPRDNQGNLMVVSPRDLGKTESTGQQILTIDTKAGFNKEWEIYKLVPENSEILQTPTQKFDFTAFNSRLPHDSPLNPVYLAHSLFETMFFHKGLGLAAPQCGFPYDVFVMGADRDNKQVMFNPVILEQSKEVEVSPEGCLSYHNLFVKVPRSRAITVQFWTADGEEHINQFQGLTARVVQHEIDHLRGRVFFSGAGDTSLKLARNNRLKLNKKQERGHKW